MMAQSAAVERAATGEDSAGTNDSQGSSGSNQGGDNSGQAQSEWWQQGDL